MPEKDVILLKLGGSVITDKNSQNSLAQTEVIDQLAAEIHEAKFKTGVKIILGHGAGSFGHPPAAKYRTIEGVVNNSSLIGASEVRLVTTKLSAIVTDRLFQVGEPAISLSPAAFLVRERGSANIFPDSVINFLRIGMLPVIHGDVIPDTEQGFTIFSGEQVLNLLATRLPNFNLNPQLIIEVGETDGVYSNLAEKDTIPVIDRNNFDMVEEKIGGSTGVDVTGGMAHKVKEAFELAKQGVPTLLISSRPGNLKKALLGEEVVGTWIRY